MAYVILKEDGRDTTIQFVNPLTIGKKSDNKVPLEEISASRYHCQVIEKNGLFYVQDLESRNGTFLNSKKIEGQTLIKAGDIIQVGKSYIKFCETLEPQLMASQMKTMIAEEPPKVIKAKIPVTLQSREIYLAIKRKMHEQLLEKLDLKKMGGEISDEELRKKTYSTLQDIVNADKGLPANINKELLIKDVTDESVGLGPMEDLLADETIDEIMVNNFDQIYIERKGKIELSDKFFSSNMQVVQAIRRIISPLGRRIDESSPMVDARLKDGSRVNAIIHPLAISGPTLTIRKFSKKPFTMDNLVQFGSLIRRAADFLALAVRERKNILISGGTGSGKTTLLNVIASFIPDDERIVTIEDAAELQLPQEHVVTLEAKPPNMDGQGAVPIRKLLINSLRMRPDRIVVGECRGGEALDMLQAMNTGHDGSMTTLHANTCRDALSRLETLVLMAGLELPTSAIRNQITSAIDIIVQTQRLKDGSRRVTSISELVGMQGEIITLQEIFRFDQVGFDANGKIIGQMVCPGNVPSFVFELKDRGIPVDMTLFEKTVQ